VTLVDAAATAIAAAAFVVVVVVGITAIILAISPISGMVAAASKRSLLRSALFFS